MEIAIILDWIEVGTFIAVAVIIGGLLRINRCNPADFEVVTIKFIEMGCGIIEGNGWIEVIGLKCFALVDIEIVPYFSFPIDMQVQVMVVLAIVDGISVIYESVFENCYMHVVEMVG